MALTAIDRIIKAKVSTRNTQPFFSYLLLHLNTVENNDIPTMGVDPKGNMFYNSKFVNSLTESELVGTIIHEVMHCALEHMEAYKAKGKNKQVLNIAQDIAINHILTNSGISLPRCGIIPQCNEVTIGTVKIKDIDKKNSSELYDELMKKLPKIKVYVDEYGNGDGKKDGQGFDQHIYGDGDGDSDEEKDGKGKGNSKGNGERTTKPDWGNILIDATSVARQTQGSIPSGIERYVGTITNPQISWKQMLQKYLTSMIPHDYTWQKFSKKSHATGTYLPGVLKEQIEVVCAVDTSGSVGQKELTEFLTEIVGIARAFTGIKLHCISADSEVHECLEVCNGNIDKIMNWKPQGGGGTDHICVYDYIKEHLPSTKAIVCFTDGYTTIPDQQPSGTNTIWVVNKDGTTDPLTWGATIQLQE